MTFEVHTKTTKNRSSTFITVAPESRGSSTSSFAFDPLTSSSGCRLPTPFQTFYVLFKVF